MEEVFKSLDERVIALDNKITAMAEHLDETDRRVVKLESTRPYLEKILEDVAKSNKELSASMNGLQTFINDMNNKIDAQGHKIDTLSTRVDSMDNKIKTIDEQGKFNIREFFKKYLPWIICLLGLGIAYASKWMKF